MIGQRKNILRLDWVIILIYFLLLGFGIGNILSSSISGEEINIFDFSTLYGKQFLYSLISLFFGFIAISIEVKFYERFSSIFYILSIVISNKYQKDFFNPFLYRISLNDPIKMQL